MRWVLVVLGFALIARLAVLAFTIGHVSYGDPTAYLTLAENIRAGRGMVIHDEGFRTSFHALYPPLYPLLLTALRLIGPLTQSVVLSLNFGIDLLAAAAMIWLASEAGQRRAGLVAAAMYLLWPTNVLFAPIAQKEGLASLLAVIAAALALRIRRTRRTRDAALLGVTAALLALTQPALAPLPFLFVLALLPLSLVFRFGGIGLLAAGAVMLPWWVRNFLVFGAFVPLTTSSGYALWVGTLQPTIWWLPPPDQFKALPELEMSRRAAAEALAWIVHNPVDYLLHIAAKLERIVGGGRWPVDRLTRMTPVIPDFLPLLALTIPASAVLKAGALASAIALRGTFAVLLVVCLVQMLAFGLWFEFSERHTYFATPFLMLTFATGALSMRGAPTLDARN